MPNAPRRNRVATLREERDRWRDRAINAEARLDQLRALTERYGFTHDGVRLAVVAIPHGELEGALR